MNKYYLYSFKKSFSGQILSWIRNSAFNSSPLINYFSLLACLNLSLEEPRLRLVLAEDAVIWIIQFKLKRKMTSSNSVRRM